MPKFEQQKQTDISDSWEKFCGANFLKVDNVKDENDAFVVLEIGEYQGELDNSPKPRLTLGHGDDSYTFDMNVTNANFCKNAGIKTPKNLLGKKMFFKKVLVRSPSKNKEVESLRISKIL